MTDEQRVNRVHEDNCGKTGKADCASCKLDCACWCHKRFRKELRERKLCDGITDRFWCVVDYEQKGLIVLRVCATYPGSELITGAYALKLNSRETDAASRLPKAESVPDECLDITDYGKVIIAARPAAPPVAKPAPQTFEEWWEVYRPQFDTYSAVGWKGVARAAWNAAKASSPSVAGGESETMPVFLAEFLRELTPAWAQQVWDWADGTPDAIFQIIDIVAPIAGQPFIKDVRGKE